MLAHHTTLITHTTARFLRTYLVFVRDQSETQPATFPTVIVRDSLLSRLSLT